MADELKMQNRKVTSRIPIDLYDKVESFGYKYFTDAIIEGLELLVTEKTVGSHADKSGHKPTIKRI
jgi:hypothetical protein